MSSLLFPFLNIPGLNCIVLVWFTKLREQKMVSFYVPPFPTLCPPPSFSPPSSVPSSSHLPRSLPLPLSFPCPSFNPSFNSSIFRLSFPSSLHLPLPLYLPSFLLSSLNPFCYPSLPSPVSFSVQLSIPPKSLMPHFIASKSVFFVKFIASKLWFLLN